MRGVWPHWPAAPVISVQTTAKHLATLACCTSHICSKNCQAFGHTGLLHQSYLFKQLPSIRPHWPAAPVISAQTIAKHLATLACCTSHICSNNCQAFGHTGLLHQPYLLTKLPIITRAKGVGFLSDGFHFLS